jgi:hypothetical protein
VIAHYEGDGRLLRIDGVGDADAVGNRLARSLHAAGIR